MGDKIVIIHAKDFTIENGNLKQAAPGKGMLNYKLLCGLIKEKKPHIEILMEGTNEPAVLESMDYIKKNYN